MASDSPPHKPRLTPLSVPLASSSSSSPNRGPHPSPHLAPLPSPTLHPSNHSATESTPLLRRVASIGPDTLRRKSHQISDLLFNHSDPTSLGSLPYPVHRDHGILPTSPGTPYFGGGNGNEEDGGGEMRKKLTGYDGEFKLELQGGGANGVRGWYDNFHTIDWIHDAIKHSLRLRRLRRLKRTQGLRGWLKNLWDGSQGWVLVTLIGFFTACIAYGVISAEMVLYDLKEGYCQKDWKVAKRFCCPSLEDLSSFNLNTSTGALLSKSVSMVARSSGGFMLQGWNVGTMKKGGESCDAWRTWAQVWEERTKQGEGAGATFEYCFYVFLAIIFSTTASALTIYFTSSTSVYSSKDSPSAAPPLALSSDPDTPDSTLKSYGTTSTSSSPQNEARPRDKSSRAEVPEPGEELGIARARPRKVMFYASGSGIPEIKTILSGFVIRGYLGSWTLAVKSVGLFLAVASGLSLGKEGPFVHIASCVGNILSRFFPKYDRNEAKRREILSAACAAGVSVAFGAPVGGVLFSLEEVSYFFPPRTMLRSFWCAAIAATTLKFLDPFKSNKIVLFEVQYDKDWRYLEMIGFLFLGVFGGLYGAWFCRANIWWTKNVRNGTFLKRHPIAEVALITLVTVCLSFFNPWSKLGGTEFVYEMFSECHKNDTFGGLCVKTPAQVWPVMKIVGIATILKGLLTVATFGIRVPAGIFIPTLAVGAAFGRISGLVVEYLHASYPMSPIFDTCRASAGDSGPLPFGQACVLPGVWAMIGAAATLAGVTRTTVSLAVIVFELTGTLTYSLPTMFAVLVAKTVADAIEPRSIYDLVIEVADLPYLDAKAEYIHSATPAEVVDSEVPFISLDVPNTVSSLRQQLVELYQEGRASGFPILGQDETSRDSSAGSRMYGYIASKELEHGLALARARGLSDETIVTFKIAQDLRSGRLTGGLGLSGLLTPEAMNGGEHREEEELDFSWLVDSAPIVVNIRSPMELLHEMFSKLGVRYLVVIDERGLYRGVIEKNRYLVYLRWIEKRHHQSSSTDQAHDDQEAFEHMVEEHRTSTHEARHRRLHSNASVNQA
ncbi:chloride channel protein [Sporobolomyces salmoneus]|uniref:chloride channel protein n=1 Tax=Sporobolomyces salmoneus TaxID=183962 RepID=UPI00316BACB3